MRKILFILLFVIIGQLSAQSVYVEDRKIYVDGQEYRINGICYARGEGNGENSGYSFNDDIPLLVDANINTIRTYAAITNVAELNAFANAGIKVIMMLNENSYTWYVNQFKDHPAILMWEFGNEFNLFVLLIKLEKAGCLKVLPLKIGLVCILFFSKYV